MEVILYLCKYTVLWHNVYISTRTPLSLPLHYCVNEMYNGECMSIFAFSAHSYWADMDEGWYWGSVLKVVVWIYFRFMCVWCSPDWRLNSLGCGAVLFGQGAQALLDVEDEGTVILWNVDKIGPTTPHHIPEDRALQLCCCENLRPYVIQIDIKLMSYVTNCSEMAQCSCCSEMVTIDRYCQDRFIDLLPVLDVDSHVSYEDLTDMWPTFQEILAIFPNLRCGDGHNLTKYGRVFLYGTFFWVEYA